MRFLTWLILPLLLASVLAGAEEAPLNRPVPLAPALTSPSPSERPRAQLAAQAALESGLPSIAINLYRQLLVAPVSVMERRELTLKLVTALLDAGRITAADEALRTLPAPNGTPWNLRAGLVNAQLGRIAEAKTNLAVAQRDRGNLPPEDQGWLSYLQGLIADREGNPSANFYQQAINAAVSRAQRTRFELALYQSRLSQTGTSSQLDLDELRDRAQDVRVQPGLRAVFTQQIAIILANDGKTDEAIGELQRLLPAIAPTDQANIDNVRLTLGLIAGTNRDSGRAALAELLNSGDDAGKQRIALRLLLQVQDNPDIRRQLDALIGRSEPHRILEDLLLARAQIALRTGSEAGFRQAEDDANRLLDQFPASVLRAPALSLLASAAWEQKFFSLSANYAAQARDTEGVSRETAARLTLLEAEADYRAGNFRSAADAYAVVLGNLPPGVPAGELFFQRVESEIAATRFEDPEVAGQPGRLLDQLAQDPAFDRVNRWRAEWNLALRLRAADRTDLASERVNRLLAAPIPAGTDLPVNLRARLGWLQALLSLENNQPEETIRRADALVSSLSGVTADLEREIRSTTILLKARAQLELAREADALATLQNLRQAFPQSDAAVYSYLIEADAYRAAGRITDAQNLLLQMQGTYPSSPYAPLALYQAAELDEDRGEFAAANNKLNELVDRYPTSEFAFPAQFHQGELLMTLDSYPAAQLVFERLINSYPSHPGIATAELVLADVLSGQSADDPIYVERAIDIYERLRDLPDAAVDLRIEAGYKLGQLYRQEGRYEQAAEIWWQDVVTEFLGRDPPIALGEKGPYWMGRTLLELADLFWDEGQTSEAVNAWLLLLDRNLPGASEAQAKLDATTVPSPRTPAP